MNISGIFSLGDCLAARRIETLATLSDCKNFSTLENRMFASMIVSGVLDDKDFSDPKEIKVSFYAKEFGLTENEAYQELSKAVELFFERSVCYEYYVPRFDCKKCKPHNLIKNNFTKLVGQARWISSYSCGYKTPTISIRITSFVAPFVENMIEQYKSMQA